jgi:hypothetical protein
MKKTSSVFMRLGLAQRIGVAAAMLGLIWFLILSVVS